MKKILYTFILLMTFGCTGSKCVVPCYKVPGELWESDGRYECTIVSKCGEIWGEKPLTEIEINRCAYDFAQKSPECRQYVAELLECMLSKGCNAMKCYGKINTEMESKCHE